MARTNNLTNFLTDVADSIRNKKGTSGQISAGNFDTEIASISTVNNQNKSANPSTSQQTITPDANYTGLGSVIISPVTSSIDSNITAGNIKKNVTILRSNWQFRRRNRYIRCYSDSK